MTKAQCQATFLPSPWLNGPVSKKDKPKKRASTKELHSTTLTLEWEFMDHVNTMKKKKGFGA